MTCFTSCHLFLLPHFFFNFLTRPLYPPRVTSALEISHAHILSHAQRYAHSVTHTFTHTHAHTHKRTQKHTHTHTNTHTHTRTHLITHTHTHLNKINQSMDQYNMKILHTQDIWSRGRFGSYKYEVANQDHSCLIGEWWHSLSFLSYLPPSLLPSLTSYPFHP